MKKSKKYIQNVGYALALMLGLTACGDGFLDHLPDERIELSASTLTDDQVIGLLNACYPGGNYGWIGEISSDNIMDNNAPHMPTSLNDEQEETHLNLNAFDAFDDELFRFDPCVSAKYQDTPYFVWEDNYSSVAQANVIIDLIDEYEAKYGTDKLTAVMKGGRAEAKLVRAYCHFILVNIFSQAYKDETASKNDIGIPYVTEVETKVRVNYDRGNVADVYSKIEQDLKDGLADLDDSYLQKPKWHFNQSAAYAFAARFYLFYHKYDEVVKYADLVLGKGQANLSSILMSYEPFANMYYIADYGNYFQSPESDNNIMLLSTLSYNMYHSVGYRYAMNGEAARGVFWHATPTTGMLPIHPAVVASFQFASYSSEDADFGFYSFKINYVFEYDDKVNGTGTAHQIRREFTATNLLLERAEAQILLGNYDEAAKDMIAYEDSRQTISGDLRQTYANPPYNAFGKLTQADILRWYDPAKYGINNNSVDIKSRHENTLDNSADGWGNAIHMGINIPDAAIPYMNCLNDMRRYETMWEGFRFFDLKRWGIKYAHKIGPKSEIVELDWNDLRRAVEVPADILTSGMVSSRTVLPVAASRAVNLPVKVSRDAQMDNDKFRVK